MAWRKLHIDGDKWTYKVGNSWVVIRGPNGERFQPSCCTIKGGSPHDYERGQWKRTSDGMILPSEVKAFVAKQQL